MPHHKTNFPKYHAKSFICYIRIIYYKYYMRLRVLSCDPLDDGWTEPSAEPPAVGKPRLEILQAGDTVLYKTGTQRTPAVLVESAGGGCWLARDARHAHDLIYLGAENIVVRLPRMDLLEEAA